MTSIIAPIFPVIYRQPSRKGGWAESLKRCGRAPPAPRSVPEGEAVLARLGGADQHTALPVDLDDLAAAHAFRLPFDLMAAAREIGGDVLRDRVLEAQNAVQRMAARRGRRFLRIAAAVQHLAEELDAGD